MESNNIPLSLFSNTSQRDREDVESSKNTGGHLPKKFPLAEAMRPHRLEDVVGQEKLFNEQSSFMRMIKSHQLSSFILWGPPGVGKTTIAHLLAHEVGYVFKAISAIFSGVGELKKIFEEASTYAQIGSKKMILFVDEIHRFNKAQQDAFLPYVENGTIVLIGATTENPSFEINAALLSRLQVFMLSRLRPEDLHKLLQRAIEKLGDKILLTDDAADLLVEMASGDGRYLLSLVESLSSLSSEKSAIDRDALASALQKKCLLYDKNKDGHYNHISALHKAIRGSNADASLYWLSRMIEGGEDVRYIGRRLLRIALEDVGLADPQALSVVLHGLETYERLGSPEGDLAMAQATIYLALAPKSNRGYTAFEASKKSVSRTNHFSPPLSILNAPTSLMAREGYGEGYIYDHDEPSSVSGQNFWPEGMETETFYTPKASGNEISLKERKDELDQVFAKRKLELGS